MFTSSHADDVVILTYVIPIELLKELFTPVVKILFSLTYSS